MIRKLPVLGGLLLVALGTASILWAGLNWPPPLWVLSYGLPGSQGPTGRVFHVEGIDFVEISPGYFRMGSDHAAAHPDPDWLPGHYHPPYPYTLGDVRGRFAGSLGFSWGTPPRPSAEQPEHWVQFRRGFAIARTEVTIAQYDRSDPKLGRDAWSKGHPNHRAYVTWDDAEKYCAWLSARSGLSVALPSESEWECACRAATRLEYMNTASWTSTYEAETRKANAWGCLFELSGLVPEWCQDHWHAFYVLTRRVRDRDGSLRVETVARAPDDGSAWERGGASSRVQRNVGWWDLTERSMAVHRSHGSPSNVAGFRPALSFR